MRHRGRCLGSLLLLALPAVAAQAETRHEEQSCLVQMGRGRRLKESPIRFVSLLGNEGSGHHLLTPVIRKLMATSLEQDDIGSGHEVGYGFTGAGDMFYAFKGGNQAAFEEAMHHLKSGFLVQQEYSFPSGGMREPDHKIYNLTKLYGMLDAAGVEQKAVIRYRRNINQRVDSVFKRWPDYFGGDAGRCKKEQRKFESLIDGHLDELRKSGVPMLDVSLDEWTEDCHKFGRDILQFLGDAKLLPEGSPYEKTDSDEANGLTDAACSLGQDLDKNRDGDYNQEIEAHQDE